jgi:hypothetical protein
MSPSLPEDFRRKGKRPQSAAASESAPKRLAGPGAVPVAALPAAQQQRPEDAAARAFARTGGGGARSDAAEPRRSLRSFLIDLLSLCDEVPHAEDWDNLSQILTKWYTAVCKM